MLMPENISSFLFAPCGMNCLVCYVHLKNKKKCEGCLGSDNNKPERCIKCDISHCVKEINIKYCFECSEFPCLRIKNLEKSYTKRYSISLLENSKYVKLYGVNDFEKNEREKWKCKNCNGIISIHDQVCSNCNQMTDDYYKVLKNKGK